MPNAGTSTTELWTVDLVFIERKTTTTTCINERRGRGEIFLCRSAAKHIGRAEADSDVCNECEGDLHSHLHRWAIVTSLDSHFYQVRRDLFKRYPMQCVATVKRMLCQPNAFTIKHIFHLLPIFFLSSHSFSFTHAPSSSSTSTYILRLPSFKKIHYLCMFWIALHTLLRLKRSAFRVYFPFFQKKKKKTPCLCLRADGYGWSGD